jgi:hypothetical protein
LRCSAARLRGRSRRAITKKAAKARWKLSADQQHQRQFGTRKSGLKLQAP